MSGHSNGDRTLRSLLKAAQPMPDAPKPTPKTLIDLVAAFKAGSPLARIELRTFLETTPPVTPLGELPTGYTRREGKRPNGSPYEACEDALGSPVNQCRKCLTWRLSPKYFSLPALTGGTYRCTFCTGARPVRERNYTQPKET